MDGVYYSRIKWFLSMKTFCAPSADKTLSEPFRRRSLSLSNLLLTYVYTFATRVQVKTSNVLSGNRKPVLLLLFQCKSDHGNFYQKRLISERTEWVCVQARALKINIQLVFQLHTETHTRTVYVNRVRWGSVNFTVTMLPMFTHSRHRQTGWYGSR